MRTKTRMPAPRFPKERMSRARTTRIASSMRTKRYRYRKRSWETKSAGSPRRRKPRQMPGKEVVAISRRAALTVRANFTRIEAKETQPAEIATPGAIVIVEGSKRGLKIPTNTAKGETATTFFAMKPAGMSPRAAIRIGNRKNGKRERTSYRGKETTATANRNVATTLARGSSRCTAVSR